MERRTNEADRRGERRRPRDSSGLPIGPRFLLGIATGVLMGLGLGWMDGDVAAGIGFGIAIGAGMGTALEESGSRDAC